MQNKAIGAIMVTCAGGALLYGYFRGSRRGSGGSPLGQILNMVIGAVLLVVGVYYFFKA
jgi:hypothetical protein